MSTAAPVDGVGWPTTSRPQPLAQTSIDDIEGLNVLASTRLQIHEHAFYQEDDLKRDAPFDDDSHGPTARQAELVDSVLAEMRVLQDGLGFHVSPAAWLFAWEHPDFLERASDAGLRVTEIVDLVLCVAV